MSGDGSLQRRLLSLRLADPSRAADGNEAVVPRPPPKNPPLAPLDHAVMSRATRRRAGKPDSEVSVTRDDRERARARLQESRRVQRQQKSRGYRGKVRKEMLGVKRSREQRMVTEDAADYSDEEERRVVMERMDVPMRRGTGAGPTLKRRRIDDSES